jgi:hypothetical protein
LNPLWPEQGLWTLGQLGNGALLRIDRVWDSLEARSTGAAEPVA